MTVWLVLLAIGAGTYLLRSAMFVFVDAGSLPSWTERPLAYVAPAAIAALVSSMVLTDHGSFAPGSISEVGAVVAAFVTVRLSGSIVGGLVVGFPVLWALSAAGL